MIKIIVALVILFTSIINAMELGISFGKQDGIYLGLKGKQKNISINVDQSYKYNSEEMIILSPPYDFDNNGAYLTKSNIEKHKNGTKLDVLYDIEFSKTMISIGPYFGYDFFQFKTEYRLPSSSSSIIAIDSSMTYGQYHFGLYSGIIIPLHSTYSICLGQRAGLLFGENVNHENMYKHKIRRLDFLESKIGIVINLHKSKMANKTLQHDE